MLIKQRSLLLFFILLVTGFFFKIDTSNYNSYYRKSQELSERVPINHYRPYQPLCSQSSTSRSRVLTHAPNIPSFLVNSSKDKERDKSNPIVSNPPNFLQNSTKRPKALAKIALVPLFRVSLSHTQELPKSKYDHATEGLIAWPKIYLTKIQELSDELASMGCKLPIEGGFSVGTRVKTLEGYIPIEQIKVGNKVASYNPQGQLVSGEVTQVIQKTVDKLISIKSDKETLLVTSDQRFYDPIDKKWVKAEDLTVDQVLFTSSHQFVDIKDVKVIQGQTTVYDISVKDHHNFYIADQEILVHNFVIPFVIVFGQGAVEFCLVESLKLLGVSCAGFVCKKIFSRTQNGRYLGAGIETYMDNIGPNYIPKNPKIWDMGFSPEIFSQTRNPDFKKLKNEDARRIARKWGYKEAMPDFDTRNQIAFKKGNIWITPDADGHNGGVWKKFNRRGKRTGTLDKDGIKVND
jgi:hypothetical protein